MHKFCSAAALTLFLLSNASASEVSEIVFTSGVTYDGKDIPPSYQSLVEAIKEVHPKATFKVEKEKLLVGVHFEGVSGKILSIAWQSDCPVNSQYRFQEEKPLLTKLVKPILVAWTRLRHAGFEDASVNNYRQSDSWAEVVLNKPQKRVTQR